MQHLKNSLVVAFWIVMTKETTDAHMNETTSIGNLVSYFNVSLKYLTVLKCRKYAEAGSSTIMTHQVKVQNQNDTSKHFANSIDISVVFGKNVYNQILWSMNINMILFSHRVPKPPISRVS